MLRVSKRTILGSVPARANSDHQQTAKERGWACPESRTSVLHARQSSDGSKKYQQSSARGAGAYLGCDAKYSMKHNFGIHLQFHFCREDETREPSSCSAENDDYPGVRSWSFNLGEQKRTSHVISHHAAVEKKTPAQLCADLRRRCCW